MTSNKKALWLVVTLTVTLLAGGWVGYMFYNVYTIQKQAAFILKSTQKIVEDVQSGMPTGDITSFAIHAGVFRQTTYQMDRLTINYQRFEVENQFGGKVRLLSSGKDVTLEYSNLPRYVCNAVKMIRCTDA